MGRRGKPHRDRGISDKINKIMPLLATCNNSAIARRVVCSREFVRQVREKAGIPIPPYLKYSKREFYENKMQS